MDQTVPRHASHVGRRRPGGGQAEAGPFPPGLVLTPVSRSPTRLPAETVKAVLAASLPRPLAPSLVRAGRDRCRRVSIVIVTFNGLVFTRLCLESLLANTDYPNYEVVVVDNGSSDGTPDYLDAVARARPNVRLLKNKDNLGFARANNQGLARATGDLLVLLNNDTVVTRGWLTRLSRHAVDPAIGLAGPVTNRTGNEAQIEVPYRTYGELVEFTGDYHRTRAPQCFDIRMVAMFCVALRREVYAAIGPLDERFEVGLFEDDDYAMRVRAAGYRVVCAEDVFVHHFGQASIGVLAGAGEYGKLFHANRRRWEQKWGIPWHPYQRRSDPAYLRLAERIRQVVHAEVPRGAKVLVVSKGDDELLRYEGRDGWHFPQTEGGAYAGHHPADSAAAIAQLERLRGRGAEFLLLPRTALWWLEHYAEFGRHLSARYRLIPCDGCCVLYQLDGPRRQGP
jgi:GT2 family glycosyltransferase